jgi:UDP-glucose:(heptosyl)LPS alpha-1,3-glucosyltransferase
MNIAIIKRKYQSEGGGGAEKYARYVVNGLIKKGHKVFVLAKNFIAEENDNLVHIPVKVNKLTASSGTTAFHKGVQRILNNVIEKHNIMLTYALSRTYPVDIFRVTEQVHIEWMDLNYPPIQKYNPRHKGILDLEKNIFKTTNTKAIVSNSELVKELVLKHYEYPKNRINVIRNGLDKENFDLNYDKDLKVAMRKQFLNNEEEHKFILFFIATNFHIKGLDSAIKAIANLPKKIKENTLLIIAGGDKPDKYQKLADNLDIAKNIKFIGSCNHVKDYYKLSDMLIYPSLGEPFGNVCLEAAACGLPVITTMQNGSCEVVEDGKNGYLIDNANCINDLTKSIEKYYNLSASEKESFSHKAIESAKEYDWKKHLEKLEKLIIDTVKKD